MGSDFNPAANTFSFYMKDDQQRIAKVVFAGAKPNNFDIATSVVAKGRFKNGDFHASEVLTKCPSKYEANAKSGTHPDSVKVQNM
jgi:cytochrome c-type biogenesis protein CcmE